MNTVNYILRYENNFYIPKKEYFNIDTMSFNPVTKNDIVLLFNNKECTNITELNVPFIINGVKITPSSIINFSKCKICCISADVINEIKLKYSPSEISLSKSNIKLKDKIKEVTYKNFIDIESTDKALLKYNISDSDLFINCNLLDIQILKEQTKVTFNLYSPDSCISKILFKESINRKLKKIKRTEYDFEYDLLKLHIKLKNNYKKVLINAISKRKYKYYNDTLETF